MRVHAGTALMLKLVCVCKSRGGKWSDDDYDVFDGERHRMHDASRRGGRRPRSKPQQVPDPFPGGSAVVALVRRGTTE